MKICLLGAQGTGKTTLVNSFRDRYTVIDGIARSVISEGGKSNQQGSARSQRKIFNRYLRALKRDDYISTRSVIDVCAYTWYLLRHSTIKGLCDYVEQTRLWLEFRREMSKTRRWLKRNLDVVICYVPVEFKLEDDGIRSVDPEYQKEIDRIMYTLFYDLDIRERWVIKGPVEERVKNLNLILELKKS